MIPHRDIRRLCVYVEALNVVVMAIPKSGSTSLFHWAAECDGLTDITEANNTYSATQTYGHTLQRLGWDATMERGPKAITLVRDESRRLVSAYRDKILGAKTGHLRHYPGMTMAEALGAITSVPMLQRDWHFRPQSWFVAQFTRAAPVPLVAIQLRDAKATLASLWPEAPALGHRHWTAWRGQEWATQARL